MEDAEKVYNYYVDELNPTTQYRYPSIAKQYIQELLSEFTVKQLLTSILIYKKIGKPSETMVKSPKYFFNNNSRSCKEYRFFLNWLEMEKDIRRQQEAKKRNLESIKYSDPLNNFLDE